MAALHAAAIQTQPVVLKRLAAVYTEVGKHKVSHSAAKLLS